MITDEVWVLVDPKTLEIISRGTFSEITKLTSQGNTMSERFYEQYKTEREELLRGL